MSCCGGVGECIDLESKNGTAASDKGQFNWNRMQPQQHRWSSMSPAERGLGWLGAMEEEATWSGWFVTFKLMHIRDVELESLQKLESESLQKPKSESLNSKKSESLQKLPDSVALDQISLNVYNSFKLSHFCTQWWELLYTNTEIVFEVNIRFGWI